ncbi:hypothetical protein [Halomarina rubra]|uniref:CARDB domain-containing protein n=1 Tax=Halomarina rubra TaxID=2071873 RepID=A0ABD6AYL1_9EURY|nr:hypothetical protein [Halomarina rubra]
MNTTTNRTLAAVFAVLLVCSAGVGAAAVVAPAGTAAGADYQLELPTDPHWNTSVDDAPTSFPVTVTNEGDTPGNQTVEVTFDMDRDGEYETTLVSETVELAPGESTVVFFSHEFEHESLGEYHFQVTSEDDTVASSVVNYCAIGLHDVTAVDDAVSAERGETVTVNATVDRTASFASNQTVAFMLDSDDDGRLEQFDATSVALDGQLGENDTVDSETVAFDVDTSGLDPGVYEYTVLVGDEGMTGTLTVETVHYQVDLVVGQPEETLGETTEDFYSPDGRLVSYLHGTPGVGATNSTTAGSLNATYGDAFESSAIVVADDGETANVTVTVAENESLTLSLVSYEVLDVDAGFEWTTLQTLADAETRTLDGGTYTFTVDLPTDAETTDSTTATN